MQGTKELNKILKKVLLLFQIVQIQISLGQYKALIYFKIFRNFLIFKTKCLFYICFVQGHHYHRTSQWQMRLPADRLY